MIGNLTADPEQKQTQSGLAISNFTVATNRKYTDKSGEKHEEVEFTKCVAFGRAAEILNQYLVKGKKVYIKGRPKTRSWDDKSGQKKYMTETIIEEFEFLGTKNDGGAPAQATPPPAAAPTQPAAQPAAESHIDPDVSVDDLPF